MTYSIDTPYFAAIDLGSNSFHLLVVKINPDGSIEKIDRVKEMVQIARGIRADSLSEEAQERALLCLERFHERVRGIPTSQVRVVGTKALRSANNTQHFLHRAEQALGQTIDIISGYEEARLVYLGVSKEISEDKGQRLVIDIGGGSTEFIIGKGKHTLKLESLSIGCVTLSDHYCRHTDHHTSANAEAPDIITRGMIQNTYYATRVEIELISQAYRQCGWDIAVGSSGTMRAIAQLMPDDVVTGVITKKGLYALLDKLIERGKLKAINHISANRRNVLPAGIIALCAIFDELQLEEVHVVDTALKEGLIYDAIGRISNDDAREHTVNKMIRQYDIDQGQASRVENVLMHFAKQLPFPVVNGISITKILHWSAQLHEMGLHISHSGYHHHGHYLIQQSDMGGFTRIEQELLALLVGSHRRKIRSERLTLLAADNQHILYPLLACLRLAVLLNRRREETIHIPTFSIKKHDSESLHIHLQLSEQWLTDHPLTCHNLEQEAAYLAPLNIYLYYQ